MLITEGRGFIIRTALDAPWALCVGARHLEAAEALRSSPWPAWQALTALVEHLPGGLHLVWDAPSHWLEELPGEARTRFLDALAGAHGVHVHVEDPGLLGEIPAGRRYWLHSATPPSGAAGHAWRQGRFIWVPRRGVGWALPGFGHVVPQEDPDTGEDIPLTYLWGEAVLPLGALAHDGQDELALALQGAQARLERALSHRFTQGAWPRAWPFQRRRTGWRLAFLGGREFASGGGTWDQAAQRILGLAEFLREMLRMPVHPGSCHDAQLASLLGHQAMREGHPWRYSLPIPPASPTFSAGLGADPRDITPLEARATFPGPLADVLEHPPVALLRVPSQPQERAAEAFLRGLQPAPAIAWSPPEIPPPGPFLPERPWHPVHLYPALADPAAAVQQPLFEDL